MTITVYRSTDPSAPVLSGTAGAMKALLLACLVNGYGSQAAAGWTEAFTGSNVSCLRPASGDRLYLQLDDSGTTSCRLQGNEVATSAAIGGGTGLFPTAVQLSGGDFCLKSSTADSVARPWMVIADGAACYVFVYAAQTVFGATATTDSGFFFGPAKSGKSGDAFSTSIYGAASASASSSQMGAAVQSSSFAVGSSHYVARSFTQLGTSINFNKTFPVNCLTSPANSIAFQTSSLAPAYPDPVTGAINVVPVILTESAGVNRGQLPGLFTHYHSTTPLNHMDTFVGNGDYAGITFIALSIYQTSLIGRIFIQISGSWF